MIQDIAKAEEMIRRDVGVMQVQLEQVLQQRDALTQQAEQLRKAIQEWSALLIEDQIGTSD